jgi:hypothetical protein
MDLLSFTASPFVVEPRALSQRIGDRLLVSGPRAFRRAVALPGPLFLDKAAYLTRTRVTGHLRLRLDAEPRAGITSPSQPLPGELRTRSREVSVN